MNRISGWPFSEPVNPKETRAMDYNDLIDDPEDSGSIKKKFEKGRFM